MADPSAPPDDTGGPGPDPAPDPAATSAAADPLPGGRRGPGRPKGSRTKAPRTARQIASAKANLAAGRLANKANTTRVGPTDRQLEEAIAALYASLGFGLSFVDAEIGLSIGECSQPAATAWLHLAQQNPAVRDMLVRVTTAGALGEMFVAHTPLANVAVRRIMARNGQAIPVAEHGPVPPSSPTNGFVPQGAQAAPGYVG